MAKPLPADFLAKLKSVTAKRARTVIEHLLNHGQITTDQLKTLYGYNHPPRAIRDVRELGIPIDMIRVTGLDGRSISAYVLGDPGDAESGKTGRKAFPKQFKVDLISAYGSQCGICNARLEGRYLQIDHRVPYEVGGDAGILVVADFMLICGSCNRAKSWSCEHCQNWLVNKMTKICATCYWASPDDYTHIAERDIRRLDIVWSEAEVAHFDALKKRAEAADVALPDFVKTALKIANS
ncbi:MAG: HNH endonuclease [Planctomycetaceae bacterium]|nr:HNH endonuclease [Planctomycetaceae bacterium]